MGEGVYVIASLALGMACFSFGYIEGTRRRIRRRSKPIEPRDIIPLQGQTLTGREGKAWGGGEKTWLGKQA